MKTPTLSTLCLAAAVALLPACSEDAVAPEAPQQPTAHQYTRDDLHPEGDVVETAEGFTVKGALHIDNQSGEQTSLVDADLDVKFDDQGRLESVSGTAQVPPPHEDVSFVDPFQADVGFFTGSLLNRNRDLPILLKDDVS